MPTPDWKTTRSLVVLGGGGFARELYWFVQDLAPGTRVAFVDEQTEMAERKMGSHVVQIVRDWRFSRLRDDDEAAFRQFCVGVAEPATKRTLVARALDAGLEPAPTLVHPRSSVREDCRLGRGGLLARDSMLTAGATIGDYVLLLDTTVGHDDVIGDYATCLPGCRVSGGVTLGEDVVLGAGTVVRDGVRVAAGVRTGALACVVRDAEEPGSTLVGVPARRLER